MAGSGVDSSKDVHPVLTDSSGNQYVIITDSSGHTLDISSSNKAITQVFGLYPDNTNQMPSGDAVGRPIFIKITDGTETATITADGYVDVKTHTPEYCFASDYAAAQAAQVIITPTAGKKIRIISSYVSTDDDGTDVTLAFGTSGNIFFKMYTARKSAQMGNTICALGAADETIKLTCGPKTFVSIGYDEVT